VIGTFVASAQFTPFEVWELLYKIICFSQTNLLCNKARVQVGQDEIRASGTGGKGRVTGWVRRTMIMGQTNVCDVRLVMMGGDMVGDDQGDVEERCGSVWLSLGTMMIKTSSHD